MAETYVDLTSIINDNKSTPYDKLNANFLQKRIIVFNQDVNAYLIDDAVSWILQWNMEDVCLAKKDRVPITIFIHSAGGDMFSGDALIDVIQNSDTPIRTIGLGFIASAAYYIYLAAPERYAFTNSIFLQHDGEIDLQSTQGKARDTMDFIEAMNETLKRFVLDNTTMSEETYDENEDREWYMYAEEAKEHGVVHKIIGKDVSLKTILRG